MAKIFLSWRSLIQSVSKEGSVKGREATHGNRNDVDKVTICILAFENVLALVRVDSVRRSGFGIIVSIIKKLV